MGMTAGRRPIVAFRVGTPTDDLLYPSEDLMPAEDLFPVDASRIVSRFILDDQIVWDGRVAANISAPTMEASADLVAPTVRADAVLQPPPAAASTEMVAAPAPTVTASSTVSPPPMQASVTLSTPDVETNNFISSPPMTADAELPAPEGAAAVGAVLFVDTASTEAGMQVPTISADATVTPPVMQTFSSPQVPKVAAHVAALPPAAQAAAQMHAPELVIIEFSPKGGQRAASQSLTGSYVKVPLTAVMPAHPDTVLVSGGIQLNYTGTLHVELDCTTTAAASGYQQLFLPYLDDVAVAGAAAGTGTRGVRHHEWDIAVVSGQVLSIWAYRTGTSSVTADLMTVVVTLP